MPQACLKNNTFALEAIDKEAGVIRGVKVAENGKMATFATKDGKAKSFTVSPAWIDAFLSHVGNRSLPTLWTHKPRTSGEDTLNATAGAVKNFRRDASNGNLVADLHVAPTDKKDLILWNAEHNPTGMMMSAVFGYGAHDPNCIPLSADGVDLVDEGAAVSALLSQHKPEDTTMTDAEIQKAINDGIAAALASPATVKALLSAAKPAEETADKEKQEKEGASAMEKAAGVTDADKKTEDEKLPTAMCAQVRVNRAIQRQLAEAPVKAEAHLAARIGTGDFKISGSAETVGIKGKMDEAVKAQLANGCPNKARAIYRVAKDKPDLYAEYAKLRDAGELEPV